VSIISKRNRVSGIYSKRGEDRDDPYTHLQHREIPSTWNEECEKAFVILKESLVVAPVLLLPDPEEPFVVETDASNVATGGILSQRVDNKWHPVAFYSQVLDTAQEKYSTTEREALAVVRALTLEKKRTKLEG